MHSQIFVNLPVKDLKRSVDFFTKLGYTFNPQFTDDNATCMILGDNLFVMLLFHRQSHLRHDRGHRVAHLRRLRQQTTGGRFGREGARRRRHGAAHRAGSWLHVCARL